MNAEMTHCIQACTESAAASRACAENCRSMAGMEECARLCDECADTCERTIETMKSGSNADCATCAETCERCAAECEKHDHESTRHCAEACRAYANTQVGG